MTEPTLFDAYAARDAAIDQVNRHADDAWKQTCETVVLHLARMRVTFTADDVWAHLAKHCDVSTHEPRALGAIFNKLMAEHKIRKTGEYIPSKRRRAAPIPVWTAI